MQTIVLNYADGNIFIISHKKDYQIEEMEEILTEKYNFRLDEIEWMTTQELELQMENLQET